MLMAKSAQKLAGVGVGGIWVFNAPRDALLAEEGTSVRHCPR